MTENTLKKLAQLLEQDQFELIFSEKIQKEDLTSKREVPQGQDIRLVYLMNDAVESFLVFRDARMTGEYHADYEEPLMNSSAEMRKEMGTHGPTALRTASTTRRAKRARFS